MKKVIVKMKLKNKDDFVQKLHEIGMKFGEIYYLHDRIYVPRGYKRGMNYPRLVMRTTMKAVDKTPIYQMLLKRHIEDSGVDVVNTTLVKDYVEMVNIIHQLGFKKTAEVSRKRQKLKMSELRIYLDRVEGVSGYYAKMESPVGEGERVSAVRLDLLKTFEVLGQGKRGVEESYAEMVGDPTVAWKRSK